MGWVERIWGSEEPRLPVHQLIASVAEAKRSNITADDVQADFNLTAQDRTEIISLVNSVLTPEEIEQVLVRAEYVTESGGRLTGAESAAVIRTRLGL